MVSQLPPVPATVTALNAKAVPVLATVMTWDSGLAPPKALVKYSGSTCRNTFAPTTAETGMVTRLEALCKTTCPTKVPARRFSPGRLAGSMLIERVEEAVPLGAERVSQLPPSAVVAEAVQPREPAPALRIWTSWAGGVSPLVALEKFRAPATLSKLAAVAGSMVRVTGMLSF